MISKTSLNTSRSVRSPSSKSDKKEKFSKYQGYFPTFSPEHGAYIVLAVSFLTGAAAAQQWTWITTLSLICAFCGFQAEHPLVLQIKQRRSWKPRFLLWTGIYGGIAIAIAAWLFWHDPENGSLLIIYGLALIATVIDSVLVWQRQQKSILNELITFAAVCLSAPLAYAATVGMLPLSVVGLWILAWLSYYGRCIGYRPLQQRLLALLSSSWG